MSDPHLPVGRPPTEDARLVHHYSGLSRVDSLSSSLSEVLPERGPPRRLESAERLERPRQSRLSQRLRAECAALEMPEPALPDRPVKGPRTLTVAPIPVDDVPRILVRDDVVDSARQAQGSTLRPASPPSTEYLLVSPPVATSPRPASRPSPLSAGSSGAASPSKQDSPQQFLDKSPWPSPKFPQDVLRLPSPNALVPGRRRTLEPLSAPQ
eukprot:EG_transcript_14227